MLDLYEDLLVKIRSDEISERLDKNIREFIFQIEAIIEAKALLLDDLHYLRDKIDRECRELQVLKTSVQEERKLHGIQTQI